MDKIGEKLYELRKKKGFSQEQLGYEVGVSRQTISKWEQDAMQPNLDNIKILCSVLNVDITYFINDTSDYLNEELVLTNTYNKASSNKVYLALFIVFSVLFLITLSVTIVVGLALLTNNTGYINANTYNIESWFFVICLIITILNLVLSVVFIFCYIKKLKK